MIRPRTVLPVLFLTVAAGALARAQPCSQDLECIAEDECAVGACDPVTRTCTRAARPDGEACDDYDPCTVDDRCGEGVCAGVPLSCDDAVACTTDVCDDGVCVHEPDDSSCPEPTECSVTACRPDDPAAGRSGCVTLSAEFERAECSEDDNPCTIDRCRAGVCAHDAVDDPQGCLPLVPSYRRAMALLLGVERILNFVLDEVDARGDTGGVIVEQLDGLAIELDAAARVLAGRDPGAELPAGALRGVRLAAAATTAQLRGRVALGWLRGTPRRAQRLLGAISRGRRKKELDPEPARELRRNGRILLVETKALKRDVKSLQRTFSVFQR